MRFSLVFAFTAALLVVSGCDEMNPAGTAEYENPDYPSLEKGIFYCGHDPVDCCFAPHSSVVWISVPALNSFIWKDVSKAIVNPAFSDTMALRFPPGLLAAPKQGKFIFTSPVGSADIYMVDTEEFSVEKVYSSDSSVSTMELSPEGDVLYLGSQGAPWHVEAVSTDTWKLLAWFATDWSVNRLEVSGDNTLLAISNSGTQEIIVIDAEDLAPRDTLFMPMRIGTMSFTDDSQSLVVLDATQIDPCMVKIDIQSGAELFRSSPSNIYLTNCRIQGSNTLLLPRNSEDRISVLNMDNMIFAPSLPTSTRPGETCISWDGEYIVSVSRAASPGTATVFHYGD